MVGADVLAGWLAFLGTQVIAYILAAALVADVHLMATSCAPGDAVEQKLAIARRASGFDAHVFGSVISDDGSDFFINWPVDIGGISIFDDDPPLLNRPRSLLWQGTLPLRRLEAGSSIDEGARVCGVLQDGRYSRQRRARPAQIAIPITTRQFQVTLVQRPHDLSNAAQLQEQLEDETEPPLHGHVGILNDHAARVPHQPDWQHNRKFAAFGFSQQAGGQPAADRM